MKKNFRDSKYFKVFFLRLEFYSRILLLVFDRNCSHPAWAEVILKKPLFFTTSESVEKKKSFPRHLQKWKCSKVNSVFFCREINCFDISMVAIKWIINYFEYCRSQKNFLTSFGWTLRKKSGVQITGVGCEAFFAWQWRWFSVIAPIVLSTLNRICFCLGFS